MFGLSAGHILILAVVVLLFGGRKLPELGEGLGKGMRAFRAALEGKEVDPQTGRILADSRNDADGTTKNTVG